MVSHTDGCELPILTLPCLLVTIIRIIVDAHVFAVPHDDETTRCVNGTVLVWPCRCSKYAYIRCCPAW